MSETEVVNQLGKPVSIRTNENELEYYYDELIVRYDVIASMCVKALYCRRFWAGFQVNKSDTKLERRPGCYALPERWRL